MEGVATLSLVCNITQVVGYSINAYKAYKHIRETGTDVEVERLSESINSLSLCSTTLQDSINNSNATLFSGNVDLARVCKKCCDAAKILEQEFAAFKLRPNCRRSKVMQRFFKVKWNAKRIEEAQHKIDSCIQEMDSMILVHLRYAHLRDKEFLEC